MVASKAAEPLGPAKTSFDDPTSGQQNQAPFGLGEFDYVELDPMA